MAFDGFGVFIRLRSWVADAAAGVKIRADFHDDEDNNLASGLTNCICKDGQTTITQNIPFNSKRITALQNPIDPQDAATKAYADTKAALDGSAPFTGDVIIRNDDPSLTLDGKNGFKDSIYGDKGGKHRWEIVLGDATLESGSNAGSDFELISYADDGTTLGNALFGNRATGLLTIKGDPTAALGITTKQYVDNYVATHAAKKQLQAFTGSGSFTVPADVSRVYVKCIGGGGGGGCKAYTSAYGGGGGGGGLTEGYVAVTPGQVIAITVGAGGASGFAGSGGVGGTSSFGPYMSAPGGTGGKGYGYVNATGGFSGFGVGGQINGGLGDGSCGYFFGFSGAPEANSPGTGGGPGGQNGTNNGYPGRADGGGGGGAAQGEGGTSGGAGFRGGVYVWW